MISGRLLTASTAAARERKTVSDAALLMNAFVTFAVVTTAWFYRLIELNIGRLAWAFFLYTAAHLVGAILSDSLRSRPALTWWIGVSNLAAIAFFAFSWSLAGGVKNPMFLCSVAVPVIVTGLLQMRLTFLLAVTASLAVTITALAQSPELAWTAERWGLTVPFSGRSSPAGAIDPLPGVEVTPSSLLLMLLLFSGAQLLFAILSRKVGSRIVVLVERLTASAARDSISSATHASVVAEPFPTLIAYSDSGQIHLASRSFLNQMLVRESELPGKTIFEVIAFDDESAVREALKNGGTLSMAYRVGTERRVADVAIHVFESEGAKFAAVRLNETIGPEPRAADAEPYEEDVRLTEQDRQTPVKMMWSILLVVGWMFSAPAVRAQTTDNWYVTFQYDQMSTDEAGGGASVEWHRRLVRNSHFLAGAFAFTLSDSTWHFARFGYVTPIPGQFTASFGADLGAGDTDGRNFDYRIVRGAIRRGIAGTRYAVEGEAQHLLVDTAHGTILKAAVFGSFNRCDASLGVHASASGNLDSQFVSGRVDVPRSSGKVFGGFALGRSQPDVRQLVVSPESNEALELFVGFTAAPQITIVFNTVNFDQATRYSALLSWKTVQ